MTQRTLSTFRSRLFLSTALALSAGSFYGPIEAQAGSCTNGNGTFFINNGISNCVGAPAGTDTRQNLRATGGLTVNAPGTFGVTTSTAEGLLLRTFNIVGNTTDMILNGTNTGVISGATYGIRTQNRNEGSSQSLTTTGDVIGVNNTGISAFNGNNTQNITLNVVNVAGNGGGSGILARNQGLGFVSVTSTGLVTSVDSFGIAAQGFPATIGDVIINANNVTSRRAALYGRQDGTGAINITANGQITSNNEAGILADGRNAAGNGVNITTTAGSNVTGLTNGISATNDTNAATNITVAGVVTGGTGVGIVASTATSQATNITLNNGANVSATSGRAIDNNSSDTTVTVNSGATIAGSIVLNSGVDTVTFNTGSNFSGVTTIDGGGGATDVLTFDAVTGTSATATVQNFETINALNGANVNLSNNALFTGPNDLNINGGSTFRVGGDFSHTNNINMNGDGTNDRLIVDNDFISNGGTMNVDVDFSTNTADLLIVQGTVTTGTSSILVDPDNLTAANGNNILLVDVNGGPNANTSFTLANAGAQILANGFTYQLQQIGDDWFLVATGFPPPPPSGGGNYEAYQAGLLDQASLATYHERVAARYFDSLDDGLARRFALWSRIEGKTATNSADASTTGTSYDVNQGRIEAGFDVVLGTIDSGLIYAGLNAGIGQSETSSVTGALDGLAESDSYSVGATLTFEANSGFYADAQFRQMWFNSDLSDSTNGSLADDEQANASIAGLELGHRLQVSERIRMVPQAQMVFAHLVTDDFTDSTGNAVTFDDAQSLTMRVGMAAEAGFGPDGGRGNVQVLANVMHDFLGETEGTSGASNFSREGDEWTGELGMNFAFGDVMEGVSFYGGAKVSTNLEDAFDTHAAEGHVGVRLKL